MKPCPAHPSKHDNVAEAKAQFSPLVRKALEEEHVAIAHDHKPLLRFAAVGVPARKPVAARGQIIIGGDLDAPLDEFREYPK